MPVAEYPTRDPNTPWGQIWIEWQKIPACANPLWSPTSDEALKQQTIAVLKRRNVIGVLSGTPERVRDWIMAAPDRFLPGLQFQLGRDDIPHPQVHVEVGGIVFGLPRAEFHRYLQRIVEAGSESA